MTSQRQVSNETNQPRKRDMTTKHRRTINNETNDSQSPSPPSPQSTSSSSSSCHRPHPQFESQNDHTTSVASPCHPPSSNQLATRNETTMRTDEPQLNKLRVSDCVSSDSFSDSNSPGVQLSYCRSLSSSPSNVTVQENRPKLTRMTEPREHHSYNSNFQLPNDILKNLTPVMKSPPRDKLAPNQRKQELLQKIRLKLSEKSSRISKKIIELQRKRQLANKYKSKKLNDELDQANLRRNQYLNMVRQRAARFYKEVQISETGNKSFTIQPTSRIELSDKTELNPTTLPKEFNEELIKPIQKLAARFLFYKYMRIVRKSQFLDNFQSMPFNQILRISNTNSEIRTGIAFILKYLQVPYLMGQEYKSFFYCFIMIADFNDCVNSDKNKPSSNSHHQSHQHQHNRRYHRNNNYNHPGFNVNTNVNDEKKLFYNNCIWLMVYKYGQYLIDEFKKIILLSSNQVSPSFLKYWHEYNFVFKVFKWNHYKNLKILLVDSINIVNKQIKALNRLNDVSVIEDLGDQQKKLNDELQLLNRYQLDELRDFNNRSEVESFVNSFNNYVNDVFMSSSETSRDPYIQNKEMFICYNNIKFYIPSILPTENWRRYWFNKFLLLEIARNNNEYKFPTRIKSGHFYNLPESLHDEEEIDIKDFLDIDFKIIPIKDIYNTLLNYYLDFTGSYYEIREEQIIVSDETDLSFLQNMKQLVLHYELVSGTMNYNNILFQLIDKCLSDLHSPFYIESMEELGKFVYKLFIRKCQFSINGLNQFRHFENLYILLNHCPNFSNLKFNVYTFNPSLIFPQFYQYVVIKHHELNLNQCKSIISSSLKTCISRVITPSYNSSSYKFYTGVFLEEILSGDITTNEISQIYQKDFCEYHNRLRQLININSLGIMFEYFQGEKLQDVHLFYQDFDNHYGHITNLSFIAYYQNNRDKIESVLIDKIRTLLIERNDGNICHIFKYYQNEMTQLMNEILNYLSFVYKVYNPILNWIYFELGKEDEI